MAAAESKKTSPSPATAASRPELTLQQVRAGRKILSAMQAHHARVQQQKLDTIGPEVYRSLRVYHGTHDANAATILGQGLRPQGGKGISGIIGDSANAAGKVFFTRDKAAAAGYALVAAGMHRTDLMDAARKADDLDAMDRIMEKPPRPTVLRLLLSQDEQKLAKQDPKGGQQDFTLQRGISAGQLLPGHLEAETDMDRRQQAVSLFRDELRARHVFPTLAQAGASLERLRRNSIAGDKAALDSKDAKDSAEEPLARYAILSKMR